MKRFTGFLAPMLIRMGRFCSARTVHRINALANYLEVGRWMRAQGFSLNPRFKDRFALFDHIAEKIRNERILYLEFGVHRGHSMRYWSSNLKNPESALHGFDSFEGLPEDFNSEVPKGQFAVGGKPPDIPDPRVRFFVGWFDKTLPDYRPPPHDRLMMNLDADLYSSTKTALMALKPQIVPGTILLFDEFYDRQHELRAFDEFIAETGAKFRFLGGDVALNRVAFERIA
jgi:hypothetical protein